MKKFLAIALALVMVLALAACSGKTADDATATDAKTYKIGICNYVDDASLNQIVENIQNQLAAIEAEKSVKFDIDYQNCNADATVLAQIIENFVQNKVDLMVGVATPVAIAMQTATEENQIPVVFAAVSDPVGAQLVESLEAPGANITGTSDYLNTNAIMELIFAADEDAKVGLLYDVGQDSSTAAIADAKAYLDNKNVEYTEKNGTTVDEISLAVDALIADGCTAIFTPSDNTVMTAELSIYEKMADAKVAHYAGADSFALNGAFVGYGVDYANLGVETANIIASILVDGNAVAETAVKTFDNGIATINTETCEAIGFDYDTIAAAFAPYCTQVQTITTAESFGE